LIGVSQTCLALLAVGGASAPVFAQQVEKDPPATLQSEVEIESGENAATDAAIVVTGSRIRRPNLDSAVPITSVGVEELRSGNVSVGDALNDLPSLRSTVGQANSKNLGTGTTGLNILDLRGLGIPRTLVVVNGRRHITSSAGEYLVDVSTIPSGLLERVDIVTGGNSAVYGSDAIAGVVNFVLKRDFDGISAEAQAGIAGEGDRATYSANIIAGRNFAGGRGNIAAAFEYTQQDPLDYTDRDELTGAFRGRTQIQLNESTVGELPAGDGIPDNVVRYGVVNANLSNDGMVAGSLGANGLVRQFSFNRSGLLNESICQVDFRPFGSGNCIGGLGATQRDYQQLMPGVKRYVGNLLGHFDVAEGFKPFFEAKYVHADARLVVLPHILTGGPGATYSINNPFLTDQARAVIQQQLPGSPTFVMQRLITDLGTRGEDIDRDTYRLVAGVEGNFNGNWRYEVAANYGEFRSKVAAQNDIVSSRFLNAINAVRNGQGQIVCGVNADANTANDDPACAPLNLFGQGNASQAARDYVLTTTHRETRATEFVVSGFVAGDSSQTFEMPGGPISFAIGAEYRKETARIDWDDIINKGQTLLGASQDFNPAPFAVREAFAEVSVPILRAVPMAHELSLSAAARVSDYKGGAGTVWAYNVGGIYAPIRDVRFRANYSRSVRAPTQTDLYLPITTVQVAVSDPCDVNFISNGPNRVRNCAALGVPVNFINEITRKQPIPITVGGAPDLDVETSDSYTAGVVIVPSSVLPGLTLSVDYYNIKVSGLIANIGSGVLTTCYDAETVENNVFCQRIKRTPDGFFATSGAFHVAPANFAAQKTSGVDVDLAYRHNFGGTRLDLRGIVSYIINRDNYLNPLDSSFRDRVKTEIGNSALEGLFTANLDLGKVNLGYRLRYMSKQVPGAYEAQHSIDGKPPTNADQFEDKYFPEEFYHSIRVGFDVTEKFEFYGGVDNLLDHHSPPGRLGDNAGEAWDVVGRFFYAGVKARF
jgi:outer membrane receptor protein involved in Fe transport